MKATTIIARVILVVCMIASLFLCHSLVSYHKKLKYNSVLLMRRYGGPLDESITRPANYKTMTPAQIDKFISDINEFNRSARSKINDANVDIMVIMSRNSNLLFYTLTLSFLLVIINIAYNIRTYLLSSNNNIKER